MIAGAPAPLESPEFFVLAQDDDNHEYALGQAAIIEAVGGRMTWFITRVHFQGDGLATAQALSAAGHEIATHAWSHGRATLTHGLEISSTNTNPTVEVDIPTSEIRLLCDEASNHVTVSWASADKTIDDLWAASAGKGWTIDLSDAYIQSRAKLSSFSDTGGPTAVPHSLALDVAAPDYAWWREEFGDMTDWIEDTFGVRPTVMAWPNNASDIASREYMRDHVGMYAGRAGNISGEPTQMLNSVEMFNFPSVVAGRIIGDGTEVDIRARARSIYNECIQSQYGCAFLTFHHDETEMTLEQIGWLVDEIHDAGGEWVTFGTAIDWIRQNMQTTDGLVYTR